MIFTTMITHRFLVMSVFLIFLCTHTLYRSSFTGAPLNRKGTPGASRTMGAGAAKAKKSIDVNETQPNWLRAQVPQCVAAPASARIGASTARRTFTARPSDAGTRAPPLTVDCPRVQGYSVVLPVCSHGLAKQDCRECTLREVKMYRMGSKKLPLVVAQAESAQQGETYRALSPQILLISTRPGQMRPHE